MESERAHGDALLAELSRKNDEAHQLMLDQLRQVNASIELLRRAVGELREHLARAAAPPAQHVERYSSDEVRIYRDTRGAPVSIHLGNRRIDPDQVVRMYEQGLASADGALTIEMSEGPDAAAVQIVVQGPKARDVRDALDEIRRGA